jgi:hypothetical protein
MNYVLFIIALIKKNSIKKYYSDIIMNKHDTIIHIFETIFLVKILKFLTYINSHFQ